MTGELDCPDDVQDLSPSAKLVYFLVVTEGPLTTGELSQWLPDRTVRRAVDRLERVDVVAVENTSDSPNSRLVRAAK